VLARAYRAHGETEEPVTLLEYVVEGEQDILAEYHPHRLTSQRALAMACCAKGQIE
jgi:hypothetical protein